ncbi:MAG: 4-(cytidine 5'-diphospho)-2-C-methyl-D-erythritol kinase [Candidatus Cloacimonetes bacterium]|jgi:4-diphosphocytidyl-2-C-methyl-D-erythritol kinase|nr:4-(cytidine 5'-diphospho)-2-C-methyl-D-erythritol kinase [Candidatus Cloacimonadota bacterium]MCB5268777.1 4-(cytidine 5'-diphospho)-2-C-methyl-D-erythritol kinase [Candidatus Cloacimonadota bacterium]MCK9334060.1 4-(cytidine 5'-diphospho)-2-C-methyl-D-erythritol kinase [Candidatus Cloacimonadota bacterium]MDD2543652.1 4-(cytidine 5'-diphospho)-2-C-methyl-D-erythritol kinase [Candidatus Cloacimonadota bacterium]MDD2682544.1 4-(cytidine 5'-diphospho)-2-C-methyl-D-erythritol kinase [Candidatus
MLAASYAKINLFLEVLGHLPNGYHQVNTVLCSIDLFDSVKYALTKRSTLKLLCSMPELNGADNLVCRIASYLKEMYQIPSGLDIELQKRIPVAAGLGGGSSNAATTVIALNKLWHLDLSEDKMHEIAASFGSDINFFLVGGTALGENRGERISSMSDILIKNILLVNPGIAIAAGKAYGATELPAPGETRQFDPQNPLATMFNRLEPAVRRLYPQVDRLLQEIVAYGAVVSMLSGSGSTCFGIFDDERGMTECQSHFEKMGYYTHITRTISRSEYQACFPS